MRISNIALLAFCAGVFAQDVVSSSSSAVESPLVESPSSTPNSTPAESPTVNDPTPTPTVTPGDSTPSPTETPPLTSESASTSSETATESAASSALPSGNSTTPAGEELQSDVTPSAADEESSPPPPEDPTSPEKEEGETLSLPQTPLSETDAKEIVSMEAVFFEDFVQNSPAPGEQPKVLPNTSCTTSTSKRMEMYAMQKRGGLLDWFKTPKPPNKPNLSGPCNLRDRMDFNIYFHYFKPKTAKASNGLDNRITQQMTQLDSIYNPLGIYFTYIGPLNRWKTSSNRDVAYAASGSADTNWMKSQTHIGGMTDLNVWIVETLKGDDGNEIAGFSTFPQDKKGALDGIVVKARYIGSGTTTVHEIGHWLGLFHTFGVKGADCKGDDGLLKTTRTSGADEWIHECNQKDCDTGDINPVYNFMSYSSCRGTVVSDGFTTDQKAAMFARGVKFRTGYQNGDCRLVDPGTGKAGKLLKRGTMQDVLEGKCPDFEVAAQQVVSYTAPAATGGSASGTASGAASTSTSKSGSKNVGAKEEASGLLVMFLSTLLAAVFVV